MPKRPISRKRPGLAIHPLGLSAFGARSVKPPISWLMDQALSHRQLISLAAGFTDNPSLPLDETREVLDELLADERLARPSLQYGSTIGDAALRRSTARRLHNADLAAATRVDDALYDPQSVLITHGSQQLLYMLIEVLCDPGDIVLVEDPTYFVFLGMLQNRGVRCRGVRTTPDGIDVEHLEAILESLRRSGELPCVKLLYLVSYAQNPGGVTTSLERKAAALQALRHHESAAGHTLYLLEDAAYRDLRFQGPDTASALVLPGARKRVIYTSTYSKPFATGIRVGYGLLPGALGEVVARTKGNHDFGTAHLLQRILTRALETGRLDRHLAVLQTRYRDKAAVMRQALEAHCADLLEWRDPTGGLYYWARLKAGGGTGPRSRLFKAALREEVLYVPGALCYADDPTRPKPDRELRLSFGNASEDHIITGIARLGRAIRSAFRE